LLTVGRAERHGRHWHLDVAYFAGGERERDWEQQKPFHG
jgi:hypothetical protein